MKYSGEFGTCKITFTILMLDFKYLPGNLVYKKCLNVSFYSLLNVKEVKFFAML